MNRRVALAALLAVAALALGAAAAVQPPSPIELKITPATIDQLRILRLERKFMDLPGAPAAQERRRLEPLINGLIDRLLAGVAANPTDLWVIQQVEPTVEAFHLEDTEARERCLNYVERIFKILGVPNDRGAFRKYMIDW